MEATRKPPAKPAAKAPAKAPAKPAPKASAVAATRRPAPKKPAKAAVPAALSPAEREAMVRLAAYFRAEQRGFAPGREWEDWLVAEAEVSARVDAAPEPAPRKTAARKAGKASKA
jgi:hypothetical protein